MNIEKRILDRIATCEKELKENPIDLDQAIEISKVFRDKMQSSTMEGMMMLDEPGTTEALAKVNAHELLQRLLQLDHKKLIFCPCKYLVSDTSELISPAGFHPDERVFVAGEVNILMDQTPTHKNVPDCNIPLFVHNIETSVGLLGDVKVEKSL